MATHRNRDWLIEHYVDRGLSLRACGAAANPPVTAMAIRKQLVKHCIPTRSVGDHMKGARNPRLGKSLSDATREKIGKALSGHKRSEESVRKQRAKIIGPKNHFYGKRNHGKGAWVVRGSGDGPIFMRSRWEVHFADWLCGQGKDWVYEADTFVLPDGRAYTPDFLSDGVYYEIKGWMSAEDEEKIAAFRSAFPGHTLRVLRKPDLQALGIEVNDPARLPDHLTVSGPNTNACPACGKTFIPRDKRSKFCSLSCNSARPRKPRVKWDCAVCGKTTEGPPSDLKYRKTCSVECGRIYGARKRSGANHWTARRLA